MVIEEKVNVRKHIKYGTAYEAAWALFSEYCENSTVHGMKFLGEYKRHYTERLFWILAFMISLYACSSLVINIWHTWHEKPVIVSFAKRQIPIWEIPFPTVTVCSETKFRADMFNFTEVYNRLSERINDTDNVLTDEENNYFLAAAQVCEAYLSESMGLKQNISQKDEIVSMLSQLAPSFNESYQGCQWESTYPDCSELFQPILTDDGICYSFNGLSPGEMYSYDNKKYFTLAPPSLFRTINNWNPEYGYSHESYLDYNLTYPKIVIGAGSGLTIVFGIQKENVDNICRGPIQGVKILLSTPGDVVRTLDHYFRVALDEEIRINVKPTLITSIEDIVYYKPNRRQCYFQTENPLKYFKLYTQANCQLECLANFTYKKCGCVKFSMPRHNYMPICGVSKITCLNNVEEQLLIREFNKDERSSENDHKDMECNCLPSCTTIEYDAEISQAQFNVDALYKAYGSEPEKNWTFLSVNVFFKEKNVATFIRSEVYDLNKFVADCGGLFGLFMGVSILSIVEIVYFCTLRMYNNLIMRYKKRKLITSTYTP